MSAELCGSSSARVEQRFALGTRRGPFLGARRAEIGAPRYHRVLADNIEVLAPLVYTPTVGHVCETFGKQFRRARGMYFSVQDRGLALPATLST